MDFVDFNNKFGSLMMNGWGKGVSGLGSDMVREESYFDLVEVVSDDDEMFWWEKFYGLVFDDVFV